MRFMLGLAVGLVLITGCQPAEEKAPATDESKAAAAQSPAERGKYLTLAGGCNDCHTPKTFGPNGAEADLTKELSGHPAGDKLPAVPAKLFGENGYGTLANNHLTAWVGPWGSGNLGTCSAFSSPDHQITRSPVSQATGV